MMVIYKLLYLITYDEEQLEKTVQSALDISKKVSNLIFTDNASNSIRVKAKEEAK